MSEKIRKIANRFPLLFSTVVMVLATILTEIHAEEWLKRFMDYQSACYITGIVEQGLVSILLVVLLARLGLLQAAGFTHPSRWKQLWLIWPILAFSLLNGSDLLTGAIRLDTSRPVLILLYTLLYISVGFVEEILFRGVMMTVMLKKWGNSLAGIYLTVIGSSVLFGLLHLVNFIMGRYTLLAVVTQTGYALFFGVFFAACMLRNNSIWPVIFGHFLFDFCGSLNAISVGGTFSRSRETDPQTAWIVILITLPLLIYGLVILRKVKPSDESSNPAMEQKNVQVQAFN
mgnify:CR=1 FL=1